MSKKLFGKVFILLLVVGLLFAAAPTRQAQAATITVCNTGGPCNYTTIQAAINAAASGDVITVAAGTYTEQLLIQKDLTLIGAGIGQTIVKAPTTGRVTAPGYTSQVWTADNWNTDYLLAAYPTDSTPISVKVTGFTFDANSQGHIVGDRFTGVYFRKVANADITQAGLFASEIKGFLASDPSVTGIRVLESSKLTLDGNAVKDYTILGIVVYGTDNLVDPIVTTSNNTLTPLGVGEGIQYRFINGTVTAGEISNNTITNGGKHGIAVSTSDHVLVKNNTSLAGAGNGITLESASNCVVQGNTIANYPWNGIAVTNPWANSDGNLIQGNTISGIHSGDISSLGNCGWSIGLDNSSTTAYFVTNTVVTGNDVSASDAGIVFYGVDATNVAHNNIIHDNSPYNLGNSNTSVTINAENNWWGSAAGPVGSTISGPVDYDPWLTHPPVHNVTQDTYFSTIQGAIDAATGGDVINVAAGTYNENLTINKALTLQGAGYLTTIIDGGGTSTGGLVKITASGTVTISGFTIQNTNSIDDLGHGVYVNNAGVNVNISHNAIKNVGPVGINVNAADSVHIEQNIISALYSTSGVVPNGIQIGYPDGVGITGTITKNEISDCSWVDYNDATDNYESNTTSAGILIMDTAAALEISENVIYNNDVGIDVEAGASTTIVSNDIHDNAYGVVSYNELPSINRNKIVNSSTSGVYRTTAVTQTGTLDATENWWGSALGPQFPIEGDVQIVKWCADAGCTTFLPDDNGDVPIIGDPFTQTGAIKIYVDGVNYYLPAGTTIQNSSPCFEVYADNIKIYADYPAAAKCVPTNGSDGIWVADDVQNLRVVNLEFDGTGQTTGSGIFFAGDVVGFQVVDNYFHDLGASGVVFTGTPSGTTKDIQGNMFRDLGAEAIVVPTGLEPDLNAEFNSWGEYAGATLTDVDTEPHTHADFYMEYEGVIPLEKVAVGNTITYTVYGNLQNISGADFTLKFPTAYLDAATPTNLSAFIAAGPAMFIVDEAAGTIRFQGDAPSTPITGENLPIFKVVFTGTTAGTGAISFDQTNDVFAMFPGYGPSTYVYAAGYVDRTVEVFVDSAAPTLTSWTPAEGNIYLAGGEDFVLTVDALDDNLFSLEIDHNVTGLPEFTVYALASNVYGSPEAADQFADAGITVTYNETTQTWVLTFESDGSALAALLAKKDVEFYAVLHDQAGKTWGSMYTVTPDNTFAYTIVFDNTAPVLESWAPAKDMTYMLTPSGDFVVTVDANDINLYELELDHSLEGVLPEFSVYADETNPYGGDGALFVAAGLEVTYNSSTQTWVLTFKNGGDALDAIIANQGVTFYAVIHDLAGNKWGSMYTVTPDNTFAYTLYQQQPIARADSTGGDVVAVVTPDGNTINFTGEVAWYPADPDLERTSGHRIGVRLSAPELDFGTSDTTFTFNGQTYDWDLVKDGDDYVLVYPKVTAETQTWLIVVTWGGGFSQTFTVNFNGTLGPVTAYTVEGEISMQGRVARNTEDVITLDGYMLDDFTADSLDKLGINYTLSNVLTGEYTITTNQPRYLNITADLDKTITLISNRTLPALWLRGGNAIWTNNEIDLDDANKVGTDWGKITDPDGNVNFDGIVNIQDLALVGGNYGLTSAGTYGSWLP